jgi:hypothetical protein
METDRVGEVITFFSYKGGTGRTMALANVAWILASLGKRVLMVDWDLEAPGLQRFFHPLIESELLDGTDGGVDILMDYARAATQQNERPENWHLPFTRVMPHAVSLDWAFPGDGPLDIIPAGRPRRGYSNALAGFQWTTCTTVWVVASCSPPCVTTCAGTTTAHDRQPDRAERYRRHLHGAFPRHGGGLFHPVHALDRGSGAGGPVHRRAAGPGHPNPPGPDAGRGRRAEQNRERPGADPFGLRRPPGTCRRRAKRYWSEVESPYKPYYAYEETLATLGNELRLAQLAALLLRTAHRRPDLWRRARVPVPAGRSTAVLRGRCSNAAGRWPLPTSS